MKCREGFVSNSSTTSFLIHGVLFEKSDIELKDGENLYGKLYDTFGAEFEMYHPPYDDEIYVGKSLDDIGRDETRGEFESKIDTEMSKLLGRKIKGTTLSGEWQDG